MTEKPTRRPLRLLVVDDSELDAELLIIFLERHDFDVTHEQTWSADGMKRALAEKPWDLVVSDCSMPRFDAFGALAVLAASGKDVPLVVVSGSMEKATAAAVVAAGARAFVDKRQLAELLTAIERELPSGIKPPP